MMTNAERQELNERAHGKPFLFRPRHHWIATWIAEQPGRSLPDKLYGIVERAYKADCRARGQDAMGRFYALLSSERDTTGANALLFELNEACAMFQCAGDEARAEDARVYICGVLAELASGKRAA